MVHEVGADEEVLNFLRRSRRRETCHLQGSNANQGDFTGVRDAWMLLQLWGIEYQHVKLIAGTNQEGFLSVQKRAKKHRYQKGEAGKAAGHEHLSLH
jgi:hypothetical protein